MNFSLKVDGGVSEKYKNITVFQDIS